MLRTMASAQAHSHSGIRLRKMHWWAHRNYFAVSGVTLGQPRGGYPYLEQQTLRGQASFPGGAYCPHSAWALQLPVQLPFPQNLYVCQIITQASTVIHSLRAEATITAL